MIEALELFGSLPLALPAFISGAVTLGAAALVVWSQRERMQTLNDSVAASESSDS